MNFEKIKFALTKVVFPWIKSHSKVLIVITVISVLILIFGVNSAARKRLIALLDKTMKDHNNELDEISKSQDDYIEKNKIAVKEYQDKVKSVEEEYKTSIGDLDKKKSDEIKKLVKKHKDNPQALSKALADQLGLKKYGQ